MQHSGRWCVILAMAALPSLAEPAGENLPLQIGDAIRVALDQNAELRQAALGVEAGTLAEDDARLDFAWRLAPAGDVSGSESGGQLALGADLLRRTQWGTDLKVGSELRHSEPDGAPAFSREIVRAEVRQPILRRFGKWLNTARLAATASEHMAARRRYEMRKVDLIVSVVDAHEGLLRLKRRIACERDNARRLDSFVRLMSIHERQGRATRVDVLRVQLSQTAADAAARDAERELTAATAAFAELLGRDSTHALDVADSPALDLVIPAPDAALATALSNRMDYAQILHDGFDARRGVSEAERALLPDLDVVARYEDGVPFEEKAGIPESEPVWYAGLVLRSELPRDREKIAVHSASIREQLATLRIGAMQASVERQILQATSQYERERERVLLAEKALALAEMQQRMARRLFESGKADARTASDAEDAFRRARNDLMDAESSVNVSAYHLLRVLGTLVEHPDEFKAGGVPR